MAAVHDPTGGEGGSKRIGPGGRGLGGGSTGRDMSRVGGSAAGESEEGRAGGVGAFLQEGRAEGMIMRGTVANGLPCDATRGCDSGRRKYGSSSHTFAWCHAWSSWAFLRRSRMSSELVAIAMVVSTNLHINRSCVWLCRTSPLRWAGRINKSTNLAGAGKRTC